MEITLLGLALGAVAGLWLRYHAAQVGAWITAGVATLALAVGGWWFGGWRFLIALLVALGSVGLGALLPNVPGRWRVGGAVLGGELIFWMMNPRAAESLVVQLVILAIILVGFWGAVWSLFRQPRR